jgi:hypothetical protein
MIFTDRDISDVIADVTMLLDAALPEYRRLRAVFPDVTSEAIAKMLQRFKGPPIADEEPFTLLVCNFARFRLGYTAATESRKQLREGKQDAQVVRHAYLGAADAMAALGAILREVKGLRYAASHLGEHISEVVKQKKSSKQGNRNRASANERRAKKANRDAVSAVEAWRDNPDFPQRKRKLARLSRVGLVAAYLKDARPPERQARHLRAMLKAQRLEK